MQEYNFELHIQCSKEFDTLHIDFSDGTNSVVYSKDKPEKLKSPNVQTKKVQKQQKPSVRGEELDLDYETPLSQEVVQKPEIKSFDRPVKVADELQGLDI
jgi:hypothetical protein